MTDWISVKDRLPEVEERVLLLTVNDVGDKKFYHVTIGMYEDGTVNAEYSKYSWDESAYDGIIDYDEEKDADFVCKGWWEVGVYSEVISGIDDEVIAWMPLPEVYEEINFVYDQSKSFVFPPFAQCCCCGEPEEEKEKSHGRG